MHLRSDQNVDQEFCDSARSKVELQGSRQVPLELSVPVSLFGSVLTSFSSAPWSITQSERLRRRLCCHLAYPIVADDVNPLLLFYLNSSPLFGDVIITKVDESPGS